MKKNIFILGGSPLQEMLIKAAKKNHHVILIDGNKNCQLKNLADEFYHLDFSDSEKLYQLAVKKQPQLILTIASEHGNLSAAIVSHKLGIKYNEVDTVYSTISKVKMKQLLTNASIPTAKYTVAEKDQEIIKLWENANYPLIVKPSYSSAARGVKLVNSPDELIQAVKQAKAISKDGHALVEEYINGKQYSVETISHKGEHHLLGITKEFFSEPPFFAETQHLFPANIEEELKQKINQLVIKVLEAFKVKFGACHLELRVGSENKISIIEIASRAGGWRSELIKYASGINYADLIINSHQNKKLEIDKPERKYSLVKMLFSDQDLKTEENLRNNPKYQLTPITWLKPTISNKQESLMDSSGYYYITASNLEDALNAL